MTDNLAAEQAANLPRRRRASSGERDDRLQRQPADTRTTINTSNLRSRRSSRRPPTPNRMAGAHSGSGAKRRSKSRSRAPSKSRSRERRVGD
ncbi:uncharacterized protein EURHEDRAFT_389131 [Aspergillus ruber CBS 135680]|uniref:Uncharacterized protein n=1 Tax=Aspergillus ruber (strain CBS 135680) TaxID=1388766 RepID=A0A017S4Z8_ASPRC|nr:uncharacterized protein EURHEDRAFT_389131 [Aspergillus ruber CBS 135680]EYE91926.1 hypothetical protein EURHEDRAFT_389131 [Aspergillus ruber CBS 135680]